MKTYVALLEPAADGSWSAYVPDLPGCVCSAPTQPDVIARVRETIAFHLDGMHADGDPIPEPTTIAVNVS